MRLTAGRVARLTILAVWLIASAPGIVSAQERGPIAAAAAQRGVKTCLDAIDRVTTNLGKDRRIGAFFFNQIDGADQNLISISLEATPSPSGSPLYISLTFAPAGERCQASIESTMTWTTSCANAALTFPQYRVSGRLLDSIQMMESDGTGRLFLVPQPSGCLTIEKAVIF